jgi:4-amino-4-deoxy-L-arabinose transferase-like glycosyltransferase
MAGVFKLWGVHGDASAFILLVINAVFSSLTCLTIVLIARRIFGEATALLAGWAWAFFYTSIYWTQFVWETSLSTFLLSLAFLFALRLEHSSRRGAWLLYGLFSALIALTNTTLAPFFPASLAWVWYRQRQAGLRCARLAGLSLLAFSVGLAPWLVRNYTVFHRFVPIRDSFALMLHDGNKRGPCLLEVRGRSREHRFGQPRAQPEG